MKLLIAICLLFTFSNLFSQQSLTICEENQNTYTYTTGTNQVGTYYWYIDGIEQNSTISSILVNWENFQFGMHTIEVWFESQFGCESEPIIYTVTTTECDSSTIYAPNAFTPDDDAHNNVWLPIGYNCKEIHYTIFNRWGEIIFESYNGNIGWDGKHNNNKCQDGIYIYKLEWIDSRNDKNIKYGHITLIR
jgi:gliding motility-associated-like protein